ncbi:acylphosphatase [Methanolobus sp. WCC5]|uniref:acylphosphatase n=1 Tax=Methanolobus sp. WCC5 TaxID=3125785 RepID=UPI00324CCB3F
MKKRAEIIIHGRVQKAGFRDLIDEIAFDLDLNGRVMNLDDGTVKVICEGEDSNIKVLLDKVNIVQYPIKVKNVDVVFKEPTDEYDTFDIIREEDLTVATYERMDAAARYMREMNSNLGSKIDVVGDKVAGLGTKIDVVGDKIDVVGDKVAGLGTKIDVVGDKVEIVGNKVDKSRIEISSEVRLNRDDLRSHLDERISVLEHELAQIKAKMMS